MPSEFVEFYVCAIDILAFDWEKLKLECSHSRFQFYAMANGNGILEIKNVFI